MARLTERAFDPAQPVYARRYFVAAGRHYKIGDPFPWQQLSVSRRKAKMLFDAGKLKHKDEKPEAEPTPAPAASERPPARQEPAEDETSAVVPASKVIHATASQPADSEVQDDLTDLDMKSLRQIADAEGAATRVSRAEQRRAIREHRANTQG